MRIRWKKWNDLPKKENHQDKIMLPGHLKVEEWSFSVLQGLKGYRAEKPQGDRYCLHIRKTSWPAGFPTRKWSAMGGGMFTSQARRSHCIDIKHMKMDNGINVAFLSQGTGLVVRSYENDTGKGMLLTCCILLIGHCNHTVQHSLLFFGFLVYP